MSLMILVSVVVLALAAGMLLSRAWRLWATLPKRNTDFGLVLEPADFAWPTAPGVAEGLPGTVAGAVAGSPRARAPQGLAAANDGRYGLAGSPRSNGVPGRLEGQPS